MRKKGVLNGITLSVIFIIGFVACKKESGSLDGNTDFSIERKIQSWLQKQVSPYIKEDVCVIANNSGEKKYLKLNWNRVIKSKVKSNIIIEVPFEYIQNGNQRNYVSNRINNIAPSSFSIIFKYNQQTEEIEGLFSTYTITNAVEANINTIINFNVKDTAYDIINTLYKLDGNFLTGYKFIKGKKEYLISNIQPNLGNNSNSGSRTSSCMMLSFSGFTTHCTSTASSTGGYDSFCYQVPTTNYGIFCSYDVVQDFTLDEWGGGGATIVFSQLTNSLIFILNLNSNQAVWLEQHPTIAAQIYNYLQTTNDANANAKAIEHLNKAITDTDYLNFVDNHTITGDAIKIWWEDNIWLSNVNNFNLDPSRINNIIAELTTAEKVLVPIFPVQAATIYLNSNKAFDMAETKFPTPSNNVYHSGTNDKKDAFRHSFFNAINVRDVSTSIFPPMSPPDIVRTFGIAHESETPIQLGLEKQMDLFNNERGIEYCVACFPLFNSNSGIADAIMNLLINGQLRYLSPLDHNDPNWYSGPDGTKRTATNGITTSTQLTQTNQ